MAVVWQLEMIRVVCVCVCVCVSVYVTARVSVCVSIVDCHKYTRGRQRGRPHSDGARVSITQAFPIQSDVKLFHCHLVPLCPFHLPFPSYSDVVRSRSYFASTLCVCVCERERERVCVCVCMYLPMDNNLSIYLASINPLC
jgi:hypothetical protein